MGIENGLEQNQGFQDDEHDSDVEARLYAEVYYSNTIIGEENNTDHPTNTPENQCTGVLDDSNKNNGSSPDLLHDKNVNQQSSNEDVTLVSSVAATNVSTNSVIASTRRATKDSNAQNGHNSTKDLVSAQRISNSSNTPNSKKRLSDSCLDDVNKSSKKKKHENQNDTREVQPNHLNKSLNESQPNQQKDGIQRDKSSLINPYNKNVVGSRQKDMRLLDQRFINLICNGKPKKKKKKDLPVKDNGQRASTSNATPSADTALHNSSVELVENNHKKDFSVKSAVIDISSESSNESFEDDSKYNTIVATDKKLKTRESNLKSTSTGNLSDSEESIFEVPVPPKPAPPLVEVKDSDDEREKSNERDTDSFLNESFNSQKSLIENEFEISLTSTMDRTQDACEIISDSDDCNSLILNCTEVQKGVSSLSEIKKMNQETSNPNQKISSISNSNQVQHTQNKSESRNSSSSNGKSANGVRSQQKPSSKDLSAEEYFFQPMTDKMTSFYNNSWGGESFEMDEIKSNMSNDPNKWAILNKDLVITGPRKRRYFGMTCARCHKDGHRQNDCPEPNKGPTCHMCGTSGHFATYCPHTQCLTCGSRQTMYRTSCGYCEKLFCTRCRSQGHKDNACPDLWRRYHHTTNSVAPKIPLNVKNVMKSRHELFCCNCTKQGHDSLACRKLRWSQHFPNPSFVINYNGPIYRNADTNYDAPVIVDDIQESSCDVYNTHNNSSNCDNSFRNSVTSKIVSTNFPRSNRRTEVEQNGLDCSANVLDPNKNVILNVFGARSKSSDESQSMKSVTLKLNVPNKNSPNSFVSWKKLSDFFRELGSSMPGVFRLEQKDKHFFMYVTCSRKYVESLSTLIKQYASRSDFERSQMLLSGERTLKKIVQHLSRKFAEMKNLNEDILWLHEETRRLHKELDKSQIQNEVDNRLKLNELILYQQKLLMLLYREGFGDESLGQLRKLFLKMEKSIEQTPDTRKNKKRSKYSPIALVSFKSLFTYLYYYNNIFVPHESKKLNSYIQRYKDNLDKRNKLLNSSLLFPEKANEKDNSNEVIIQDSTSSEKIKDNPPEPLPSTSQELPISQNAVKEATVDDSNSKPLNSKPSNRKSKKPKQKSDKKLNHLYLQAIKANDPTRKEDLMQNFRNFIKNARNCLDKATKLGCPQLREDIVNLQRGLEDETHLDTNMVTKFKKKVKSANKESFKKQRAAAKQKKNLKSPNSDNIYKKFCASL